MVFDSNSCQRWQLLAERKMARVFEKWGTLMAGRGSILIFIISLTVYLLTGYGFIMAEEKTEDIG